MHSIVLILIAMALTASTLFTVDVYQKLNYTSMRDHRKQVFIAGLIQVLVVCYVVGVLLYRHVRLTGLGW
ncbi:hypothetical protein D3C76_37080 [compost metagenome]